VQVKPYWAAGLYESPGGALNLVYALSHMAIRHTQQQRLGGQTVCKLPEKTEETIAGDPLSLPCVPETEDTKPFELKW
jgi:hypothetical protein